MNRLSLIIAFFIPCAAFAYLPGTEDLARHWAAPAIDREPVLVEYAEQVSDGERRWKFVLFEQYWSLDFFAPGATEPIRTYRNGKISRRQLPDGRKAKLLASFVTFDEILFTSVFSRIADRLAAAGLQWDTRRIIPDISSRSVRVRFGAESGPYLIIDRDSWRPLELRQSTPRGELVFRFRYRNTSRFPFEIEFERNGVLHVLTRVKGPRRLSTSRYRKYRYH